MVTEEKIIFGGLFIEYPELVQSVVDVWTNFVSADGFGLFGFVLVCVGFVGGCLITLLWVVIGDIFDMFHAVVPLVRRSINERKAKKSGKLTNAQRLELLESKIDSLADIVISSSPEEK